MHRRGRRIHRRGRRIHRSGRRIHGLPGWSCGRLRKRRGLGWMSGNVRFGLILCIRSWRGSLLGNYWLPRGQYLRPGIHQRISSHLLRWQRVAYLLVGQCRLAAFFVRLEVTILRITAQNRRLCCRWCQGGGWRLPFGIR